MREGRDLGITRKHPLVLILLNRIHFHSNLALVEQLGSIRILLEELIKPMAPNALLTNGIEQHHPTVPSRFLKRVLYILGRIAGWIVPCNRLVV